MSSIVVCVEIGTSGSGLSYALPSSSSSSSSKQIYVEQQWRYAMGNQKTRSCILLDDKDRLVSFGYEAIYKYNEYLQQQLDLDDFEIVDASAEKDQIQETTTTIIKNYYLFDQFKMNLFELQQQQQQQDTSSSKQMMILSVCKQRSVSAKTLFTETFRFFHRHALKRLPLKQIQWVITVPSIWSEFTKQMLREAAIDSGMPSPIIVFEPEAASRYIAHTMPVKLETNDSVIVCDAGGGTVDIAAHSMLEEEGKVKELIPRTGGPWGSTQVDKAFHALLQTLFGDTKLEQLQAQFPCEWDEMRLNFEKLKASGQEEEEDEKGVKLYMTHIFRKVPMVQSIKSVNIDKKGYLTMTRSKFKSLFDSSIDAIVQALEPIVDKLVQSSSSSSTYLFLVGGYGESEFLKQALTTKFQSSALKLIIPPQARFAVMGGAVLLGMDMAPFVQSRITPFGVGVKSFGPYDAKKHPIENRVVLSDGRIRCKDLFARLIQAGGTIRAGEKFQQSFGPIITGQNQVELEIFQSSDKDVTFVTESSCRLLGVLSMKNSTPDHHSKIDVVVSVSLSDSGHLQVSAVHSVTKEQIESTFSFLQ